MKPNGYSSDSTYYSTYEKSRKKICKSKNARSTSASQILKRINSEVQLHLQGIKLLGNHEVTNYMEVISEAKQTTTNKVFIDSIQASLTKIHKMNELFQRSLSSSEEHQNIISDPLEQCGVSQDLKMLKGAQILNPMMIPCADISEQCSFGSDMLSNKNFLTGSSNPPEPTNEKALDHCDPDKRNLKHNTKSKSMVDLFLSQENEYFDELREVEFSKYEKHLTQVTDSNPQFLSIDSKPPKKTKVNQTNIIFPNYSSSQIPDTNMIDSQSSNNSLDAEMYIESFASDNSVFKVPTFNYKLKHKIRDKKNSSVSAKECADDPYYRSTVDDGSVTSNNIVEETPFTNGSNHSFHSNTFHCEISGNKENVNSQVSLIPKSGDKLQEMASKIKTLHERYFKNDWSFGSIIPETDNTQTQATNLNFDTVKTIGNSFQKLYNERIQKLSSDVCCGQKNWEEIHNELENTNKITEESSDMLSKMFEKIEIEERKIEERKYTKRIQDADFHNFSEDDAKELDMKSLLQSNEVVLKEISTHFKSKLLAREYGDEQNSHKDSVEDYSSMIDWRKIMNAEK
ncbi:hypothetical protein JTB14_005126 [Gonioctena quinquepunctata]|nr:hypothetical protein JTB14_005126 [Gonioctena quinquepunctata]